MRRKYTRWSKEHEDLLSRLWNEPRIRTATIARQFGVTRQAIQFKARALGLPKRHKAGTSMYDLNKVIEMWRAGYRHTDIQKAIKAPHRTTVSGLVYKLGLPRRERSTERTGNRGGWQTEHQVQPDLQNIYAEMMKQSAEDSKARMKRKNP